MKDQINRFARGVFEYNPPQIQVKENSIYAVVDKNRGYSGSITISVSDDQPVKGIIRTDNDKVVLDSSTFVGNRAVIGYTVLCRGALNGDIIDGCFDIVSNGGQKKIPYSFRVEAGSYDSSAGVVRNLFQFAALAQNRPEEALKLFEAPDFSDVYIGNDLPLRCIYEGLIKGSDAANSLEEFLIAVHKKNAVSISIVNNSVIYDNVRESFKDYVTIDRDTWGFTGVWVSTNADFVRLERTYINAADFAGNRYDYPYILDVGAMHAGKNFGEIFFDCGGRRTTFRITAGLCPKGKNTGDNELLSDKLSADLMTLYVRFRTHKINISDWIRESQIVIEKAREIDDKAPFYRLALAQLNIAGGKFDEAKELIENVKDEITKDTPKDYPLYCYFLYINTLYNRDRAYSRKVSAIVRECYKENEDWRILWVLLFMDEELEENKSLKLLRIKEQFNNGCTSPAMYIEACNILNEHPQLLRVLNFFECNVLLFGARNGMVDGKLAGIAASMLSGMRTVGEGYIRLLAALYDMDEDEEILECLCKTLIRNQRIGRRYLKYYAAGIECELKVTNLYEYYILSRDPKDMSPLPRILLMYFGYNNNLDYVNKAYLYANIIYNKADNLQMYRSYLPHIELFVSEQLLAGHIDENLAYIYANIVKPEMINEDNAAPVCEIYSTYMITCHNPAYTSVVIRHKESNSEKEYPITDSVAFVRMYTDEAAVIFVDAYRRRYIRSVTYEVRKLLDDENILRCCLAKDGSLMHARMADCEKYVRYPKKSTAEVSNLIIMSKTPNMSPFYRNKLTEAVIDYYYDSFDPDGFDSFIADVNLDTLSENAITKIIEINIIKGNYKQAFEMIRDRFALNIMPKRLLKMCSVLCEIDDYENNPLLLQLCHRLFVQEKYDQNTVRYLAAFFNGNTGDMTDIWRVAVSLSIDTYELEERTVVLMLFSNSCSETIYDIFENYYAGGANDRIVEAYLSYQSYEYFVREKTVSDRVFELIETTLENEKDLPIVCKMALARYYSELTELSRFRKELAQSVVSELSRRGYIFPFFSKLSGFITLPLNAVDRTMAEYRTNPEHRVVIHYTYEDNERRKNYVSEDMKNVYEGIFVKDFVLFYGESVSYYISEEDEDGETITESRTLTNNNVNPLSTQGRYEALNDILASRSAHDGETFRKLVHSYAVTDNVVSQLFRPM